MRVEIALIGIRIRRNCIENFERGTGKKNPLSMGLVPKKGISKMAVLPEKM